VIGDNFWTDRVSPVQMPLPVEDGTIRFAIFGDRTGGPADGVQILAQAVDEVNLFGPELVMTVGDLVEGYGQAPAWLEEMAEYRSIMDELTSPWFPVAGNHDVYWRGPEGERPPCENESLYEEHFGPLWYAFEYRGAVFIVLYSDEGNPETDIRSVTDRAAQQMSARQFAFLETTLNRSVHADHVFVFVHHPRWLDGRYGDGWDRVHDRLAEAGNVSAVFAGHIHHMRYDGIRDEIEYFTLATVGGSQGGFVPEAGYLHQYMFVTTHGDSIDVVSVPVGEVDDPRLITGEIADDLMELSANLRPRIRGTLEPPAPGATGEPHEDTLTLTLRNPVSRPVEFELTVLGADRGWLVSPEHTHVRVGAGDSSTVTISAAALGDMADPAFGGLQVELVASYLADGWRVPVPAITVPLPLSPTHLPSPSARSEEFALRLDGDNDSLQVADDRFELPDGPFTVEAWMNASDLSGRRGLICKTEGSEFGIFVSDGQPKFDVHLNGAYVAARADEAVLTTNAWHHVAGVYDGTEVRLYVDGALVGRATGSGARTPNRLPLTIGADVGANGSANSHLSGQVDEVRVSAGVRYEGERFTPTRRHTPDGETTLLVQMDATQGLWVWDASPMRSHPERLGGAAVGRALE
jgi:hypothetical protein